MAEFLTIVHTCKDFAAWKSAYDADAPHRAAAGLTELSLGREMTDPNVIGLIFGVTDRVKAKAFLESDRLRQVMAQAGIVGAPTIGYREGTFTPAGAAAYLTLNCKISGIDKFRAGYAMDAADRAGAGLTDLGLMQSVADPNDLFLVWSVADIGRANAFLRSAKLAEHQIKNAGLVGRPEPHFWTIWP
jgi:hypothetical protein